MLRHPRGVLTDSSEIMMWLQVFSGESDEEIKAIKRIEQFSDSIIGPRIRDAIFMKRDRPTHSWDTSVLNACQQGWVQTMRELEPICHAAPWFYGGKFSLADCALIPRFCLAEYYGLGSPREFKNLNAWFQHAKTSQKTIQSAPMNFLENAQN